MRDRSSIVVSLAPFDGHPFATAVETVAALGVTCVEPAIIAGYTDPFEETIFTRELARSMRSEARQAGVRCVAFSAHVDIGAPGGRDQVMRRLEFAREMEAGRLVTNAALEEYRDEFFRAMDRLIPVAEELQVVIALENPGDGRPNLMDSAEDATALATHFASPWVSINYDPGNLLTHRPGIAPEEDARNLGARLSSLHLKDGAVAGDRLRFTALGRGAIDYARILAHTDALTPRPEYSIEIPLRVSREPGGRPYRDPEPAPLEQIRDVLQESLAWLETH